MPLIYNNTPPDWRNEGTEPPDDLKTTGFTAGYKPPAAYFNWFWTKVSKCIDEIQKKLSDSYDRGGRSYALHSKEDVPSDLRPGDICFIWDQYESGLYPEEPDEPMQAAVYTNMPVSEDEPENAEYWGKVVSESKEGTSDIPVSDIVSGDMEVAEEPSGTKIFFNKIN